jgi:methylated-DNA-[protein]-cysteine S-methyltransferase
MRAYVDAADSPAGRLSFAVNGEGAFLCLRFEEGDYETSLERELAGFVLSRDANKTKAARAELLEYATGERKSFDAPIAMRGTAWQKRVWSALARVPFGETRTYSEVAAMAGRRASAARAVGSANAANRLPLVVPCHRVVGSDGSLTGFAGGVHIKERLLAHEARVRDRSGIRRRAATRNGPDGTG